MNKVESNVYRELQKSLDKLPISFPETKSGVEIRILKRLFTPKQAKLGSKLDSNLKSLNDVYLKVKDDNYTLEDVERILDEMYEEGLIVRIIREKNQEEVKYYVATPFVLGFYEFQMDKMDEEYIHDTDQYFEEAYMEELNKTKIPQLRTIPIEQDVKIERKVANYDNVRNLIENCGEPIVINECICRKKNDIIGKSCEQTDLRETCFSFRSAGIAYLKRGLGRVITKEEAFEIIEKAQEDGLVLQPGNSQRPQALCCCCGCCCNLLVNEKKFDKPAEYFATNYYAQVNEELCVGCGVCENHCQMNAISIIEEKSNINLDRCIGCGVCTSKCPEDALILVKKEEELIPPKNTAETYKKIALKKEKMEKS